ncbi:MAG: hypothetical protein AABY41_05085 [Nitrospirota bacterium]
MNKGFAADMEKVYYIGLDIHKETISYCIKLKGGAVGGVRS